MVKYNLLEEKLLEKYHKLQELETEMKKIYQPGKKKRHTQTGFYFKCGKFQFTTQHNLCS